MIRNLIEHTKYYCHGELSNEDGMGRCTTLTPNVRRYVQLAQSRGGACFCTRGAMQGYAVITLFSRWQKP